MLCSPRALACLRSRILSTRKSFSSDIQTPLSYLFIGHRSCMGRLRKKLNPNKYQFSMVGLSGQAILRATGPAMEGLKFGTAGVRIHFPKLVVGIAKERRLKSGSATFILVQFRSRILNK